MSRTTVVLLFFILLIVGVFLGCVRQSTPANTPTPSVNLTPTPTPPPVSKPTVSPTTTTSPIATPTPTEAVRLIFFLKVTSPQNEAIVDKATLEVSGETTPDAAVSVNGQFVEVDASGHFKTTVTLVPGANTLDVVASDFTGRRASAEVLPVDYPGGGARGRVHSYAGTSRPRQ